MHHCWLWGWRKWPQAKEYRQATKSWKGKKMDFLLKPPEEHSPANSLILDLWPPELSNSKLMFFKVARFVVICQGSDRKQVQCKENSFSLLFWYLVFGLFTCDVSHFALLPPNNYLFSLWVMHGGNRASSPLAPPFLWFVGVLIWHGFAQIPI